MVSKPIVETEKLIDTIAEMCQFLSTLMMLYGTDLDPEDRALLILKLQGWKRQYRGMFAAETAERCLSIFNPTGSMAVMIPMMKEQLHKGVDNCKAEGCNASISSGRELLQCGK